MPFNSPYTIRLTLQHRALYCYLILSLWIFILLAVMYKYIGSETLSLTSLRESTADLEGGSLLKTLRPLYYSKEVLTVCNPPNHIAPGSEGGLGSNYSLEGILIVLRHGDRGPLTHIQNISSVNCFGPPDPFYTAYEEYIENITGTPLLSQLLGIFHGIPPLPAAECGIGLLTRLGTSQLLTTGRVLRDVYKDALNISALNPKDDVKAYSTRYRRTMQSGLAFLFTFLTKDAFPKLVLQEAPSLAFCFDDCACPAADFYSKKFVSELSKLIKSKPSFLELVRSAASIVYEFPDRRISTDPHALNDALLTYLCHGADLPCIETFGGELSCVLDEHIHGLFSYLEWEAENYHKSSHLRKACLLKAYGLLKNIVSNLLRLVSEKKPRVVLYSGHDKTISYLTTALGVINKKTVAPHYASRLIFEVYKSMELGSPDGGPIGSDYFFRLLFNGDDITNQVIFCRGTNLLTVRKEVYLCHIESIVRYLHDDYFSEFNTTNIKESCALFP